MNIIRRACCVSLLAFSAMTTLQAQTLTASDVFKQMPDSILPYLSKNSRLDMLDFMDSHMKARVQNKFDGHSEMLSLADDSLTIQMSSAMRWTLRLQTAASEINGSRQLICIERTVGDPKTVEQLVRTYYSLSWRKLDETEAGLVK